MLGLGDGRVSHEPPEIIANGCRADVTKRAYGVFPSCR